ncbi:thiosulfate oxidation carrier protein SoxY [Marinobacterium sp. MBR-109]|jgi:sulfur-oxidizing protein SoxY|uniref:thiosulfate oxidation carrier protein SoxY n=1 Tax=Marinobacterium sp. MBR-109 TaxID=3156462 RepID=UPI00339B953F
MRSWILLIVLFANLATGSESVPPHGLRVQLPAVIEDGAQVPLRIAFDERLDPGEYLKTIQVQAPLNPEPDVISFEFLQAVTPIRLATRIRLSESQPVTIRAQSSTGRQWQTEVQVRVALSGCLTGPAPSDKGMTMHTPRVAIPGAGQAGEVRAQVRHPMENGFRNGVRNHAIAPNRVQTLSISRASSPLVMVQFHAGTAANPYVSIWLNNSHDLTFSWQDLQGRELHR